MHRRSPGSFATLALAFAVTAGLGVTACSDGGGSRSDTTSGGVGTSDTRDPSLGPTTTFMPNCSVMPTPAELLPILGLPVDEGIVTGSGTCEFRGLNDQSYAVTLALFTDPVDIASFNDLVASSGINTPLNDPTVPGAAVGPDNVVFVIAPNGIYTARTHVNDTPLEQQIPISVAILAKWLSR